MSTKDDDDIFFRKKICRDNKYIVGGGISSVCVGSVAECDAEKRSILILGIGMLPNDYGHKKKHHFIYFLITAIDGSGCFEIQIKK
ncbi:hypothetical protein DERP_001927 [Dermatophagoides pteronyssinus]|uniref:Uncharacterized protein n=1 Tax=Dermatophagoides pteronyssinus TaxID=6956 RepID=A0ABQ8JCE9_DERPT|nr:hypothetical protein DERP_001927 [Dermatophagoides pteronyssinus]